MLCIRVCIQYEHVLLFGRGRVFGVKEAWGTKLTDRSSFGPEECHHSMMMLKRMYYGGTQRQESECQSREKTEHGDIMVLTTPDSLLSTIQHVIVVPMTTYPTVTGLPIELPQTVTGLTLNRQLPKCSRGRHLERVWRENLQENTYK